MSVYSASSVASSQVHAAQSVAAPHRARAASSTGSVSGSSPIVDQLDISAAGQATQFVDQVKQLPDIRQNKVDSLRAQIASGTYETSDKLSAALNSLLNEIA